MKRLAEELAAKDNTNYINSNGIGSRPKYVTGPGSANSDVSISSPPIVIRKQFPLKIVPYEEILKRADPDLDYSRLEVCKD